MLQDFLNLSRLKASTQPTPQLLLLWTSYSLMLKITEILGFPGGPLIDSILLMQGGVGSIPGREIEIQHAMLLEKKKPVKNILRFLYHFLKVYLESLLSESCPSLGVTVHLTSLGYPPMLC